MREMSKRPTARSQGRWVCRVSLAPSMLRRRRRRRPHRPRRAARTARAAPPAPRRLRYAAHPGLRKSLDTRADQR